MSHRDYRRSMYTKKLEKELEREKHMGIRHRKNYFYDRTSEKVIATCIALLPIVFMIYVIVRLWLAASK